MYRELPRTVKVSGISGVTAGMEQVRNIGKCRKGGKKGNIITISLLTLSDY
jgi:hypothetical protein